jgi:hypothetical protein
MYPEILDIEVSWHSLKGGRTVSPLKNAIEKALDKAGSPYARVVVGTDSVWVYYSHPDAHDARYYIPDDAWKFVARHAAGRRVKPGVFRLKAIYRKPRPSAAISD